MRATNHVLTGALIGAAVTQPVIALPMAFLSHFALDALPHLGTDDHSTKLFFEGLVLDAILALSFLLVVFSRSPDNWSLMIACGILAASPDLMWLPRYIKEIQLGHKLKRRMNLVSRFHSRIQWGERPNLLWLELAWGATVLLILVGLKKI